MFSQRGYENDEAALTAIFNRFERWQTIRAVLLFDAAALYCGRWSIISTHRISLQIT